MWLVTLLLKGQRSTLSPSHSTIGATSYGGPNIEIITVSRLHGRHPVPLPSEVFWIWCWGHWHQGHHRPHLCSASANGEWPTCEVSQTQSDSFKMASAWQRQLSSTEVFTKGLQLVYWKLKAKVIKGAIFPANKKLVMRQSSSHPVRHRTKDKRLFSLYLKQGNFFLLFLAYLHDCNSL